MKTIPVYIVCYTDVGNPTEITYITDSLPLARGVLTDLLMKENKTGANYKIIARSKTLGAETYMDDKGNLIKIQVLGAHMRQ